MSPAPGSLECLALLFSMLILSWSHLRQTPESVAMQAVPGSPFLAGGVGPASFALSFTSGAGAPPRRSQTAA